MMTGRAPLPPRWALGYQQSRWGYSRARVTEVAGELRARGLPADGMWLDIQHMRGFRTFTWDASFADADALTAALTADGFALTVIADPGIKAEPGWDVFDGGVAGDHFLREPGGDLYQGTVWPGPAAFPDFTRAETRAWWGQHVGTLVDRGVAGIWLDVNEPTTFPEGGGGNTVPDDLPVAGAPGATMAEVHNIYAVLEAEATWTGMRAAAPARRPFVLSRAGAAGIQRWAAVWTGDAVSSWPGLQQTLPMLLGMGLSGLPLVGSDVGGYSGGATPELYARWMAIGSISPFFRGHVTQGVGDQEPWAFGPEVEEISRRLMAARYRLLPYLYTLMADAAATGAPILRPLVYEFPDDEAVRDIDDQAMLGPFLLVAPVVEPGATSRSVYLPAGRWLEARSGAAYDGPTTIDVDVTLAALPIFLRAGAIAPSWVTAPAHTAAAGGPLQLDLHPGPAGTTSELVFYDDAGDGFAHEQDGYRRIRYRLEGRAGGATLRAERTGGALPAPDRILRVRIRRLDQPPTAVRLDGRAVSAWSWDERDLSLRIELPDRDAFELAVDYDRALTEPAPPVRVHLEVQLPASTPADAIIHVATSATGWTHQPLTRTGNVAAGDIDVPRGSWFFYKFTRGDWTTVEKDGACAEMINRYRFGATDEPQVDTISSWRDQCE